MNITIEEAKSRLDLVKQLLGVGDGRDEKIATGLPFGLYSELINYREDLKHYIDPILFD